MTITNIEELAKLAATSQASYANFGSGVLVDELTKPQFGAKFTKTEAEGFSDRYTYIDQQLDTGNGFSAVVFWDNFLKKYVLAIRGTDFDYDKTKDLLITDIGHIGTVGFANNQAADLYRFWKKLTTPSGKPVNYTDNEKLMLFQLQLGDTVPFPDVTKLTDPYKEYMSKLALDEGRPINTIPTDATVDVTGHSLGGHLAYLFARFFPQNIDQVVTLNGPGLDQWAVFHPNGNQFLTDLGFPSSAWNRNNITALNAEGDLIHTIGSIHPGTSVDISQEVGMTPVLDGATANHSKVNGVDGLNLLSLFSKLDPTLAYNATGILKIFMRASSNKAIDTYENMLDGLRKMLLGGNVTKTPIGDETSPLEREQFYKNIDELSSALTTDDGALKYLVGHVVLTSVVLDPSTAKADYGQFLALYYLAPFAIEGNESLLKDLNSNLYDLWLADKNLSAADKLAGKQNFSDTWYIDRAKFVERLISRNTDDTEIDHKNPHREVIYFNDIKSGTQLTSVPELVFNGRFSTNQVPTTNAFFGGDENNLFTGNSNQDHFYGGAGNDTLKGEAGFDYLEGNAGNDLLYGGDDADHLLGGAGDDQLFGDGGNDILEGGQGNDTYAFTGTFGRDIIKDSDGQGSIVISGVTLSTLIQSAKDSIIYYDNLTNPTRKAVLIHEGDTDSLMISTVTKVGKSIVDSGNSITIKNWNSQFNINLQDASTPTPDAHVVTIAGDAENRTLGLEALAKQQYGLDYNGFISNHYTTVNINGGAGNEAIVGAFYGNDTLNGGDGTDFISSGFDYLYEWTEERVDLTRGVDLIHGGDSSDYIVASFGGTVAHGDAGNDVLKSNGQILITADNVVWRDTFPLKDFSSGSLLFNDQVTKAYEEFPSVNGSKFILKRLDSTTTNTQLGDFQHELYTLSYQYTFEDGKYKLRETTFSTNETFYIPQEGKTPNDYADLEGANLFGDEGNDILEGGMYSDKLSGGADQDALYGGFGNDVLDGGNDQDALNGGAGNDLLIGGSGNDNLVGGDSTSLAVQSDNDTLYGGEGNDGLYGAQGDDYLDGGSGADYLNGNEGNDYLYGGDDNGASDTLSGGETIDDDIIVVGINDHAIGGGGKDIYIWDTHQVTSTPVQPSRAAASPNTNSPNNLGIQPIYGSDAIVDSTTWFQNNGGENTIALAGVQSVDQLSASFGNDMLQLVTEDHKQLSLIGAQYNSGVQIVFGPSVEELVATPVTFSALTDAHFLNGIDPLQQENLTAADIILSRVSNQFTAQADSSSHYLVGGLADDTLQSHVTGSNLVGGLGNDHLLGDTGDDSYLIRKGDGDDDIIEKGGSNTVKFGQGITATQITAFRNNADLVFKVSDEQSVTIRNAYDSSTGQLNIQSAVQQLYFYDGSSISVEQLLLQSLSGGVADDVISGFSSNDVISGGKGNDRLIGGAGNDSYTYKSADGFDVISDVAGVDVISLVDLTQSQVTAARDANNNLLLRFATGGGITVAGAFNASGNFTTNAIESIKFMDNSVWDQARIKSEVNRDLVATQAGTEGDDKLVGDSGKNIYRGGKGNDKLSGDISNDVYRYALGDGKDIISDRGGSDRIEFTAGINQADIVVRSNGDDFVVSLIDGNSLVVKNMFSTAPTQAVEPAALKIIPSLINTWIPQAEKLIKDAYGLVGKDNLYIKFAHNLSSNYLAIASYDFVVGGAVSANVTLTLDLDDFSGNTINGSAPLYSDRIIAHEMVHAVMAANMDMSNLPGWFLEGAAELIHGADERVKQDLSSINSQQLFNENFKTTSGSPSSSAGYSVSYIATKLLDDEIRTNGGQGIKDVFAQLQLGKSLDEALQFVSQSLGNNVAWNNLVSFEAHIKESGFSLVGQILNLNNSDTGAISGSDYGFTEQTAASIIPNNKAASESNFTLIFPVEYVQQGVVDNAIESIKFSDNSVWDINRIRTEIAKGTIDGTDAAEILAASFGNDILTGKKGNDLLIGGKGDDKYRYVVGDGEDTIRDAGGADVIEFGAGINALELYIEKRDTSLVIQLNTGGSITIEDAFDGAGNLTSCFVERLNFSGNSYVDLVAAVKDMMALPLVGSSGNDTLNGSTGNDTLKSSSGDDQLNGGKGNDVYRYAMGDGNLVIEDGSGNDSLVINGLSGANQVIFRRDGGNLVISLSNGKSIVIKNEFDTLTGAPSSSAIETIDTGFGNYNGTSWNDLLSALFRGGSGDDVFTGFASDNVLSGGLGNDRLNGGAGNDLYIYNLGDANDTLFDDSGIDTLSLNVKDTDVLLSISDNKDLVVKMSDGSTVKVLNAFDGAGQLTNNAIERISFQNTTWNAEQIRFSAWSNTPHIFNGTTASDSILGLHANDTLSGGLGDDRLNGELGDDVYRYSLGDGADEIADADGRNFIEFASNIAESDVNLYRAGSGELVIDILGGGSITWSSSSASLEAIHFSNNVTWDAQKIAQLTLDDTAPIVVKNGTTANDSIVGSAARDSIVGGSGNDVLRGGAGNDTLLGGDGLDSLYGGTGYDSLDGGAGDDLLDIGSRDLYYSANKQIANGGDGNDTFIVRGYGTLNGGAGDDTYKFLDDTHYSSLIYDTGGSETIELGPQITKDNIVIRYGWSGNDAAVRESLFISRDDGNSYYQPIIIKGMFSTNTGVLKSANAIESIKFADGTVWNQNTILQHIGIGTAAADEIYGLSSADNFIGGLGDDAIYGGDGDDTYFYNFGDGNDDIGDSSGLDTIRLGSGITPDQISFSSRSFAPSTIDILDKASGQISGSIYFGAGIENLIFDDGTVFKLADAQNYKYTGTDANDLVTGPAGNDGHDGLAGSRILVGKRGDDIFNTKAGDNIYEYYRGDGNDVIDDYLGADQIIMPDINSSDLSVVRDGQQLVLKINSGGQIAIQKFFTADKGVLFVNQAIEKISFKDDVEWNLDILLSKAGYTIPKPNKPVVSFIADGTGLTGTATPGTYVNVIDPNKLFSLGDIYVADDGTFSVNFYSSPYKLINGETLYVVDKDEGGNLSDRVTVIAPDKTAPVLSSAAFDAAYKVISGRAEAGSTVRITNKKTAEVFNVIANSSGAYSYTFANPLINKEVIEVVAIDLAQNQSTPKTLTAPDKTSPDTPSGKFESDGKTIKGIAEPGSTVTFKNSSGTSLTTTVTTITANATTGAYSAVLTTALLDYQLVNVYAKDLAGNSSLTPLSIHAPDTTKPPVTNLVLDNTTYKTITGKSEPGSTITVKNKNTGELLPGAVVSAAGTFTINLNVPLKNKELIEITATDISGNVSLPATLQAPDKTPPVIQSAAFDPTGKYINGKTEANSNIIVKNASDVQIGTIKADSSGNFKVTLGVALTHKETVKVYAQDDVPNTSPATSIQAPLLAAARATHLNSVNEVSIDMQLNSLIQTMAAFSPPAAAESHKLVGVYDRQSIILASQS